MGSLNIKTLSLILATSLSFFSGYHAANWVRDKAEMTEMKRQIEADREMREKLFSIATETLEKTKNIKIENKTIYKATEREILKEPVYTNCVLTEEGFKLLNEGRK